MATLPKLPPLTAKTGESLTIDQKNFQIIGVDSGKVYGQGSSLADALARQQQLAGRSTPTVSGRPDLFATTPTAQEQATGIQPVVPQAGMAPVAPQIATGAQLAQKAAGTLPTPKAEQKIALTADQQQAKFAEAVKTAVNAGKEKGLEAMYGKPESFDNQLRTQMGLLASALLKETLTPQELRWLSPSQQAAVKSGDENLIRAARGGLNTILQGRMEQQEKEQARQDKLNAEAEAKTLAQAETTFNLYSKYGLWDKLDDAAKIELETKLGLPPNTIQSIKKATEETPDGTWELRSTDQGLAAVYLDPKTGETKFNVVVPAKATGGVGGTKPTGDLSKLSNRAKAVYDNPALLNNYTPTEKGKILDELSSAGADVSRFTLEKVAGTQKQMIADQDSVLRESDYASSILEAGLQTGLIQTPILEAKAVLGFASEFTKYKSALSNLNSTLLKARSGAAVTPQEYERIRGFIPLTTDDEKTAVTKIQRFKVEMELARQSLILRTTQSSYDLRKSVFDNVNLESSSTLDDLNFSL